MYITQDIATRIKVMTKAKKTTQKEMLSHCGININAITDFAKGKQLSCISLAKIADYLECSVDYLLGRTDNPTLNHQDNNSGNIVNGSNGDNSPLTVRNDEATEMEKEISSLLSDMSYRERTELMCLIYKFVDEHKKI